MFSSFVKTLQVTSRQSLSADLWAGLTVGVIALPLSMALAIASGVAPQYGLYTAALAGIIIALTGGSQVNISGPTAAFVVVLLPVVHQYGLGGLLVSGFMAGIILVLLGVARLGRLIEIVPYPVVVGFTSGIGVVIATLQIPDFLGLDTGVLEGHYHQKLFTIIQSLPGINGIDTVIGVITLAVLIIWPRLRSRVPGHLVALLIGTLLAVMLSTLSSDYAVATLGSRFYYDIDGVTGHGIPPLLPALDWPWQLPDAQGQPLGISFDLVQTLLPSAITIAVLGALESLLCAVVADGMSGNRHNPNDELIGQGIGNMVIPFFGGIPATAAIARTAANIKAGAQTPLSSVVHGVFILVAILSLAPLLAWIPMASLAALLLMVAWNMSETRHFIRILRVAPRDDVMTLMTCFSLTVIFDMTVAVAVGMGLAAMLFIRRSIVLTDSRKLEHIHDENLPKEIIIYDINGPLFFGSAQKAVHNITSVTPDVRVIILDMSEVTMIDMSAIIAMETIVKDLGKRNISLIINNLQARMIMKLRRAGVRRKQGVIEFARDLGEATQRATRMLPGVEG